MMDKVEQLLDEYCDFTELVAPKDWRICGHHCSELRKMYDEIEKLEEITEKQKEWLSAQVARSNTDVE